MNNNQMGWSRSKIFLLLTAAATTLVITYFAANNSEEHSKAGMLEIPEFQEQDLQYGFDFNQYHSEQGVIEKNQFLSDILLEHKVSPRTIQALSENTTDIFDVKNLRAGKNYIVLNKDTATAADAFIYLPDRINYVVYDLKDPCAFVKQIPLQTEIDTVGGQIKSSLWVTLDENGIPWEMIDKMEDALAWSVDFYHIDKGDNFKLLYEKHIAEDEVVGIGNLIGAYFETKSKKHYSIFFESEEKEGYFDLEGKPMKKAFLKSPVKYSRISSAFNPNRMHPILKRRRPHLGTDYAAPRGTPIYAVANGIISRASYSKGNGRYVKVKHDKTYSTQYLHMSKIAKGIKPGVAVKQGEVIGYVGSTGLATGPHVCFRFWKNGVQVDHRKLDFPEPMPMSEELLEKYASLRDSVKYALDMISYDGKVS